MSTYVERPSLFGAARFGLENLVRTCCSHLLYVYYTISDRRAVHQDPIQERGQLRQVG